LCGYAQRTIEFLHAAVQDKVGGRMGLVSEDGGGKTIRGMSIDAGVNMTCELR